MVLAIGSSPRQVMSWAQGDHTTLAEQFQANNTDAYRSAGEIGNMANIVDAWDNRLDAVKKATGVTFDNPFRSQLPDADYADFLRSGGNLIAPISVGSYLAQKLQGQLKDLQKNKPDAASAIRADVPIQYDADQLKKQAEDTAGDLASRATYATRFAAGVGSMPTGMALNSQTYTTLPFYEIGVGTNLALQALKVGAINAGGVAIEEPWIQQWRAQAGQDHGVDQAAADIGGAFVMGAGMEAGFGGLAKAARWALGRPGGNLPGLPAKGGSVDAAFRGLDAAAGKLPEDNLVAQAYQGNVGALVEAAKPFREAAHPAMRGAIDALEADHATLIDGTPNMPEEERMLAFAEAMRHVRDGSDTPPPPEATHAVIAGEHGPIEPPAAGIDDVHAPEVKAAVDEAHVEQALSPIAPNDELASIHRGDATVAPNGKSDRRLTDSATGVRMSQRQAEEVLHIAEDRLDRDIAGGFRDSPWAERVASLKDLLGKYDDPTLPNGKPFQRSKLIPAGDKFAVRTVTDERHGLDAGQRTYRIYRKPDGDLSTISRPSKDLGSPLGFVDIHQHEDGRWEVGMVEVRPKARGQGVAKALYGAVEKDLSTDMRPSGILLTDGHAMWKARDPEAVKYHQRLPADDLHHEIYASPKFLLRAKAQSQEMVDLFSRMRDADGTSEQMKQHYQDSIDRHTSRIGQYDAALSNVPPEGKTPEALANMFSLRSTGATPSRMAELSAAIDPILKRLPKQVRVSMEDAITRSEGGRPYQFAGAYSLKEKLIRVAMNAADKGSVAHEELHALRDLGLFTDKEWRTLVDHARESGVDQEYGITTKYAALYDKMFGKGAKDRLDEELVAHLWEKWNKGDQVEPAAATLFERIKKLLAGIVSAVRGKGFHSAEDIFGKIESGEIGKRAEALPEPTAAAEPVMASIAKGDPGQRITEIEQRFEDRTAKAQETLTKANLAGTRMRKLKAGETTSLFDAMDPDKNLKLVQPTEASKPPSYFAKANADFHGEVGGAVSEHGAGMAEVLQQHGADAAHLVEASRNNVKAQVSKLLDDPERAMEARNMLRGGLDSARQGDTTYLTDVLQGHWGFDPESAAALASNYAARMKDIGGVNADPIKIKLMEKDIADRAERDAATMKRARVMQQAVEERAVAILHTLRDAAGQKDIGNAAMAHLEPIGMRSDTGILSVDAASKRTLARAMSIFEQGMYDFQKTWIRGNRQNSARLTNVVRELKGEATGDQAAKGLAKAWTEATEFLRQDFNAKGGAIDKLDGWALPQFHDSQAVVNAGRSRLERLRNPTGADRLQSKQGWISYITPLLDAAKMKMGAAELRDALGHTWENITSNGWAGRDPVGTPMGKGALYMQRNDPRFLIFKDADSWLKYHNDYGVGGGPDGIFGAMMAYFKGMSRDIGAMEVLGPNPTKTLGRFKSEIKVEAGKANAGLSSSIPAKGHGIASGKIIDPDSYAGAYINEMENTWQVMRGTSETPDNKAVAGAMRTVRHYMDTVSLGGAAFARFSDPASITASRIYSGLPVTNVIKSYVREMRQGSVKEAIQARLILDSAMQVYHEEARFAGSLTGKSWISYIGDRVLELTGHNAMVQAARHAAGTDLMADMHNFKGLAFDRLDERVQRTLQRNGVDAPLWDRMRAADSYTRPDGLTVLRANEMDRIDPALADRYLEMIHTEMEKQVPTGSARARAFMIGSTKPGSLQGEFARSMGQYKLYAVTNMMIHMERINRDISAGRKWSAISHAGTALILTTLAGALRVGINDVIAGRDQRPAVPFTASGNKFWGAAVLAGGGLGLFGDLLFSDTTSMRGGVIETLAGPTAGRAAQLVKVLMGQALRPLTEDQRLNPSAHPTPMSRQLIDLARTNTPGGNIWMVKLLYQRLVLDKLQQMYDPDASASFRRQIDTHKKTYGNAYWWAPGATAPNRAPGFTASR